jgi:Carboxypeptidase regulatory-like domain/TonB dependent receptor-like, beta-barrel/TonB-dependent Receptor Plug Domain
MLSRDDRHQTPETLILAALMLGALLAGRVHAQVVGATLSGTVTDPSGAAIPGAKISIKNRATAETTVVTTDSAGFYSAPNLLPGSYDVTVTAPGFATQLESNLTLTVGQQQSLNVALKVGQATQQVEVTGAAPTVELASSAISDTVNATTVRELPLNGRSWVDLGSLQPGVNQPNTQKPLTVAGRGQRGFGTQVSISGNRPDQNAYRLDGINVNDYANSAPSNVLGGALGVDAIQEFSVLTGNYPAQYGRASGGVFNAITRSGTNQFHGSAYEFLRNSSLDARNFFDGSKIPAFRRNQFGAAAGGPIRKDRTFIFGDYEGLRQSLGVTQVGTTLSDDARNGILHHTDGTPYNVPVDPEVARFIQAFYPRVNAGLLGVGDTGRFTNTVQQTTPENFFTSRFDQKFSEKDSLYGTYLFDNAVTNLPDLFNAKVSKFTVRRQLVAIEETHTFSPQFVNSFRVGLNRSVAAVGLTTTAVNPAAADPSFGGVPGQFAPMVTVAGLSLFTGGLGAPPFYGFHFNSYQVYDDAFLTRGTHSIKFGGAFERLQDNDEAVQGADGNFTFKLPNFLTNNPSRFAAALSGTIGERGIRESILGVYVQDDIRFRPNLTLNIGLRYETASVPTEVHNEISNFVSITDPQPHLGSPYFQNFTRRNFEPRVGFSWDPFHNGKTAVRGGFGIYDMEPLPYEFFLGNATVAPFFEQGSFNQTALLAGTFPTNAYPLIGGNPKTFKYSLVQTDSSRRYMMQWNLNIQREVAPNLTVMVGYVGSRGLHLPFHMDDMDIALPAATPAGYLWPLGSIKVNPNIGVLVGELMMNQSFYDGGLLQITKTMAHGLQLQGSYTWARNTDYSSGTFAGDAFGNAVTSLSWFDRRLDRGPTDFNITQNLVINGTWNLPNPHWTSGGPEWALSGWELGAIFKANTGVPFTATFGSDADPLGLGSSDPIAFPDRLTVTGCGTLVNPGNPNNYIKTQCFALPVAPSAAFYTANCDLTVGTAPQCFNLRGNAGRNILTGPGLANLDFSLFKNNYVKRISESFNVQFRFEVFNILNRANFLPPPSPTNTDIFDSTGAPEANAGLITSTQTPSRQIQFALKLSW